MGEVNLSDVFFFFVLCLGKKYVSKTFLKFGVRKVQTAIQTNSYFSVVGAERHTENLGAHAVS